jgi:hypothetical protein
MLWPEGLSLTAFTLLGQGLYTDFATLYGEGPASAAPQPLTEAWHQAPYSYLVLTQLGWMAYHQQRYAEAVRWFEQALTLNPGV